MSCASFQANHIESVPAGSLLPNLTEVSLLNNPIRAVDDEAFNESATTLQKLTFSNALFTRMPDALGQLKVLTYLSIHNTHIQDWNTEIIKNIGHSVRTLKIGNVGLTLWPSWIQYFSNLTEISISESSFSSLPSSAFSSVVHSLTKLSLTNNNLTSLPRAFSQLYRLECLTVSGTNVDSVLYLPLSSNLTTLCLANNNISNVEQVSVNLCPYAYSLKYIDLHGNKLTYVPDLSYMINLQDINLNDNNISVADTGSLPSRVRNVELALNALPLIPHFLFGLKNVWYLNLPNNSINELRGEDFPPATMIANLGFNLITNLADTSFPEDSNITVLSLNNNPIASIAILAFRNLASLSFLNLQYTKLTRLPLALSSLSHLSIFDISGSTDLVCTCAEKSLQQIILNTFKVTGTCGDTSIQYFFANLTSGCGEI